MPRFRWLMLPVLGCCAGLPVQAQEHACSARAQSETARIERQFAKERPQGDDQQALQRWSRQLQAALAAVARESEQCERHARPQAGSSSRPGADACLEQVRQRGEELGRRYGGRELTPTEQLRQRAEEDRLLLERQACVLRGP